MDVEGFSDPVKVGPGMWFKMHVNAVKAITDELKEAFIININADCDNFKCKKCQGHFRKFIDTHSFKNYWRIIDEKGRDVGFFKWTWELHNLVNKFLNKYQPNFQEAYEFYSDREIGACFNCGSDNKIVTVNKNIDAETRTLVIPPILTSYIESKDKTSLQPFHLITKIK